MASKPFRLERRNEALLDRMIDAARSELHHYDELHKEYLEECEREGVEPITIEGEMPDEVNWPVWVCVNTVFPMLQRGAHPWPTVHRDDIFEVLKPLIDHKLDCLPRASEMFTQIQEGLAKLLRPIRVRVEVNLDRFSSIFLVQIRQLLPADTGQQLMDCTYESGPGVTRVKADWEPDHSLSPRIIVRVEGVVCSRVFEMFAGSVRSLVAQAISLSAHGRHESGLGSDYADREPPSDPAWEQLDYDAAGCLAQDGRGQEEQYFKYSFHNVHFLDMADLDRFIFLLMMVFKPGLAISRANPEDVLRRAAWGLTQQSQTGLSPLAFLSCFSIFESCIKLLLFFQKSDEQGSLWQYIGKKLNLSPEEASELDKLHQKRNAVAHEVAYCVDGVSFLQALRLAWTTSHHLLAKLSNTYDTGEYRQYDLAQSIKSILTA